MTAFHTWGPRVLWGMFAVAACFALYIFSTDYVGCRTGGVSNVGCFAAGLIVTFFKLLIFAIASAIRILTLILP
jgi:hypothetical protein